MFEWNGCGKLFQCSNTRKLQLAGTVAILTFYFLTFTDVKSNIATSYDDQTKKHFRSHDKEHIRSDEVIDENDLIHKKLPGIIGIGCKKCGTGAFRQFIRHHSRISTTRQAETHFFDDFYFNGTSYYKSLLPNVHDEQIAFEKTPNYFGNKLVPRRIVKTYAKENTTNPTLLLVFCDPVQRAFSDFSQAKRHPEDPLKLALVKNFESFDDYVSYALGRTGMPTDDVNSFFKRMNALLEDKKLWFLLRGVYAYFLTQWLQIFERKDFVFVDGDELLTNPGNALVKAQRDLGLRVEITPRNFVFVPDKGFYCIKPIANRDPICLGHAKGNTRKIQDRASLQPDLSEESAKLLKRFYKPFIKHLSLLLK